MGLFTDPNNNFTIYDVPKGGGTTIRAWISYAGSGELQLAGTSDYYYENITYSKILNEWGYLCDWFREVDSEKICIKRDPIDRFISCYEDKIVREGFLQGKTLDYIIDNIETIFKEHEYKHPTNPKVGYLWYHFAPQVNQLGKDYNYYNKVFDINDIGIDVKKYLESKWKIILPDIHCRNNSKKKTSLTKSQIDKLKKFYEEDYSVGWC